MLKEEYRTHTSYSGKSRFMSFPVFVFFLSLGSGLTINKMLETVSLTQFALFAHSSAFMYGVSVGAFGLMGREYLERRYGRSNYLVAMPYLLPLSFKTTFLGIYLRDALFYVVLLLVPATLGLVAAAPFMGFAISSIGLFFIAILVSFMFGMSLSFLASVIYIRNVPAFIVFTAAIAVVFVLFGVLGIVHASLALGFLAIAAIATVVMTALAYALIEVRINIVSQTYTNLLPKYHEKVRWLSGLNRTLISKEFVDLRRSGTIAKMFFSFVLPMLFLSFTVWFVNYGLAIPVGFNAVFYAAMTGFVGVLMYSWLNNIDLSEYYSLIPVTVPQLVKVRILVFLFLTLGISAFFVVAISVLNGETELLWLALIVMLVTSLYMVVMTAYLTGLKTNTFLFDTSVLAKFSVMSFFPDLCLTILSFSLLSNWLVAGLGISLVLCSLAVTTFILYRGIDKKWSRTPFY
jgi:hypothetical protein